MIFHWESNMFAIFEINPTRDAHNFFEFQKHRALSQSLMAAEPAAVLYALPDTMKKNNNVVVLHFALHPETITDTPPSWQDTTCSMPSLPKDPVFVHPLHYAGSHPNPTVCERRVINARPLIGYKLQTAITFISCLLYVLYYLIFFTIFYLFNLRRLFFYYQTIRCFWYFMIPPCISLSSGRSVCLCWFGASFWRKCTTTASCLFPTKGSPPPHASLLINVTQRARLGKLTRCLCPTPQCSWPFPHVFDWTSLGVARRRLTCCGPHFWQKTY